MHPRGMHTGGVYIGGTHIGGTHIGGTHTGGTLCTHRRYSIQTGGSTLEVSILEVCTVEVQYAHRRYAG